MLYFGFLKNRKTEQDPKVRDWDELVQRVRSGLMVRTHSGRVHPGEVFVAQPPPPTDGARYIPDALARGAGYVVAKDDAYWPEDADAQLFIHDDPRKVLGDLARAYFKVDRFPMRLVGVTGTNGKTTVAYIVEHLLGSTGSTTGMLGTVSYRWPGAELSAPLTTPGCWQLHELLRNMAVMGVDTAVMEVSSHALDQQRVAGLDYDVAVLTNVTQDHLDYHGDMDSYFLAKARLFVEVPKEDKAWVINSDDPMGRMLLRDRRSAIGYGLEPAGGAGFRQLQGRVLESGAWGLTLETTFEGRVWRFSSPLVGRHNASNLLAAQGVGLALGLGIEDMEVLGAFRGVPGRLERVDNTRGLNVFVDYAHTPDALENVLSSLKQLDIGRLIVVFGAGGDRDRTKRPLMGRAACEHADVAVLTSDNPRHEDPERIMADVREGMGGCARIIEEVDRREAIGRAIELMGPRDALVIAGKGHEDYQQVGDEKLPFSDVAVARELLG
jgi:UDP-N-acetylmuramoyl-L-alanyl-D-glutamate--2,6-diaminopimelate ligase